MPPPIYLASSSPRRRELLTQIGVAHTVLAAEVEECPRPGESAEDYVLRVARDKALAGWNAPARLDHRPVLSADTAVVIDGDILGKPHAQDEALRMLAPVRPDLFTALPETYSHPVCDRILANAFSQ